MRLIAEVEVVHLSAEGVAANDSGRPRPIGGWRRGSKEGVNNEFTGTDPF